MIFGCSLWLFWEIQSYLGIVDGEDVGLSDGDNDGKVLG